VFVILLFSLTTDSHFHNDSRNLFSYFSLSFSVFNMISKAFSAQILYKNHQPLQYIITTSSSPIYNYYISFVDV